MIPSCFYRAAHIPEKCKETTYYLPIDSNTIAGSDRTARNALAAHVCTSVPQIQPAVSQNKMIS